MTDTPIGPDHPLRYPLVNELHARPSPRIKAPCTVVMLGFKEPRDAVNRDRGRDLAHLADLTRRHGAPDPQPGTSHYTATLGRHALRWEGHAEFVSYTAIEPGSPPRPFDPALADIFPADWQARAPGRRLAAVMIQVEMLPDDPDEVLPLVEQWFAPEGLAVSWVLDGAGVAAGDFRIDPAGWMRFAVFVPPGIGPGRIGRVVQRLLELETYRAMSMLGLPRARDLTERLNTLDPRLTGLVEGMASDASVPEAVLHELLDLSSRLEGAAMQHSFRFGATEAYEAIVHDRIAALREDRFEGRQMIQEFMARRYEPAMRTVKSARRRLATMIDRAGRAGELLRTRVDVQRSAQNQSLLARMDRRADLQLRLQHTVEGLSVVAISYYAVGLLGYAVHPVAAAVGMDKTLLLATLTPVVVLGVWLAIRRIRARLHDGPDGH
ncbi:DUF3422 family protein [uncultured Paracoccus sp.]|uniref:DUF3422 family protein n=1 Tax=uncultured Paracoccus sp. TaxID=189685 RepID=UPI00261BC478|nr:DUF3422 domain-containing protein [uncultured Paracoccus sp.]